MIYPYKMASGSFERMNEDQIKGEFGNLMGQPVLITVCMVLVAVLYFGIVNMGFEKGSQGITKIMMGILVLLLVILAVHFILLLGVPSFSYARFCVCIYQYCRFRERYYICHGSDRMFQKTSRNL